MVVQRGYQLLNKKSNIKQLIAHHELGNIIIIYAVANAIKQYFVLKFSILFLPKIFFLVWILFPPRKFQFSLVLYLDLAVLAKLLKPLVAQ